MTQKPPRGTVCFVLSEPFLLKLFKNCLIPLPMVRDIMARPHHSSAAVSLHSSKLPPHCRGVLCAWGRACTGPAPPGALCAGARQRRVAGARSATWDRDSPGTGTGKAKEGWRQPPLHGRCAGQTGVHSWQWGSVGREGGQGLQGPHART